jgi:hypothetical protein
LELDKDGLGIKPVAAEYGRRLSIDGERDWKMAGAWLFSALTREQDHTNW